MRYIRTFVRFCFNNNKNTTFKKQKTFKTLKHFKNMFLNFYKNVINVIFTSMGGPIAAIHLLRLID